MRDLALSGEVEKPSVKVEVLADRELRVERERLRHVADAVARGQVGRIDRLAQNRKLRPASRAADPVSIFIVVVFPHPFGPRNPKISPRSMVKLTPSTAVKSPKRQVRSRAAMTVSWLSGLRGGIRNVPCPVRARLRQEARRRPPRSSSPASRLDVCRRAGSQNLAGVSWRSANRTARLLPYRRWQ